MSTDESSATEEEGGQDDFATLLRKRRVAAGEEEKDQTSEQDNSVVKLGDDERVGQTRSGSTRKEVREDARNNNLQKQMEKLQYEVNRMRGEHTMAAAVMENSKCLKDMVVYTKRERETEGKKDKPDPVKMELWSEEGEELKDNNYDVLA